MTRFDPQIVSARFRPDNARPGEGAKSPRQRVRLMPFLLRPENDFADGSLYSVVRWLATRYLMPTCDQPEQQRTHDSAIACVLL
jgi:hypothetical protein